jgi:hypothetical protein
VLDRGDEQVGVVVVEPGDGVAEVDGDAGLPDESALT